MRCGDLAGRRVALLGFGIDVRAAYPAIAAAGPAEVRLVEQDPRAGEEHGLEVVSLAGAADWAEVFVRSPGFRRYQQPLTDALERGARMTTPVDLWISERASTQRIVGVTGTKGKSTTSHLIADLAAEAGLQVGMAGNMGVPIFGDGWDDDAPVVVVEISSFQASDLHTPPDVAVLTSLAEDHLDWHGTPQRYADDKLRVLRNDGGTATQVFVPAGDRRAVEATTGLPVTVVDAPSATGGAPRHRVQNAALAAAVVEALGGPELDEQRILEAAQRSLQGRLDAIEGPRGVTWVDDALGSNPTATSAGLAWARELGRPTVWLLGGAGRGVPAGPLVDEVARWAPRTLRAVALPDDGDDLARECGVEVAAVAGDLTDAVRLAEGLIPDGGLVLFSPSAPTPPRVGSWKDRSGDFRAAVEHLRSGPPVRGATP